jgi:hypothetical protein
MRNITMLKKTLASSVAFALIALSPGLAPYEAAAQMRSAPAVPVENAPLNAAPLGLPSDGVLAQPETLGSLGSAAPLSSLEAVGVSADASQRADRGSAL